VIGEGFATVGEAGEVTDDLPLVLSVEAGEVVGCDSGSSVKSWSNRVWTREKPPSRGDRDAV
jgi:hypothetical protein